MGPESSVGKVHSAELNQRMQELAVDLLGADSLAWDAGERAPASFDATSSGASAPAGALGDRRIVLPREVQGFLRSRANTIEGGTSEVNRNVLGERVLGLPREPDPYLEAPWEAVPRS